MRDAYDVLGISRGASFDEIRAAYRRACKKCHPDLGGTHEQMVELNTAYAFILNELKQGAQQQEQQQSTSQQQKTAQQEEPWHDVGAGRAEDPEETKRFWRKLYQDIDEELEVLRRASQEYEDHLSKLRQHAWDNGERVLWAKLTWADIARFFWNLVRSGVKGLATLFAAIVGVGTMLVEANFISALIIIGAGIGFFVSLALKNDKGGFMSASLLMFGVATIWVPALRAALFGWPLATLSVLICLALIFKFAQGGIAGLMTGGVLGLFLISVILEDAGQRRQEAAIRPPSPRALPPGAPPPRPNINQPTQNGPSVPRPSGPSPVGLAPEPPPPAPQPRELLAAQGSILKFAVDVPYLLKVRSGMRTMIVANSGSVAFYRGGERSGECMSVLEFSPARGPAPYTSIDGELRACGEDAVLQVTDVR